MYLDLHKKIKWNTIGQISHMLFSISIVTIIVRFIGKDAYSFYIFFQTLLASAIAIEFGITNRVMSSESNKFNDHINQYFNSYYFSTLLLLLISFLALNYYFLVDLNGSEKLFFAFLISFYVILNFSRSIYRAYLLRQHKDQDFNVIYILGDVGRIIFILLSIYFSKNLTTINLFVVLILVTLIEIYFFQKKINQEHKAFKPAHFFSSFKTFNKTKTFYLYSLLLLLVYQAPMWFIPRVFSSEDLAVYGLSVLPASLLITVFYPITSSLLPYLRDRNSISSKKNEIFFLAAVIFFLVIANLLFASINNQLYLIWLGSEYIELIPIYSESLFVFGSMMVTASIMCTYFLSRERAKIVVNVLCISLIGYYFFLFLGSELSLTFLVETIFLMPLTITILLVVLNYVPFTREKAL